MPFSIAVLAAFYSIVGYSLGLWIFVMSRRIWRSFGEDMESPGHLATCLLLFIVSSFSAALMCDLGLFDALIGPISCMGAFTFAAWGSMVSACRNSFYL